MDYFTTAIVVALFLAILYVGYRLFANQSPLPSKIVFLSPGGGSTSTSLDIADQSSKVSLSGWVYINQYPNVDFDLFRQKDFCVTLLANHPKISVRKVSTSTTTATVDEYFKVPDTVPLQTWFFIIVSIDGTIVDFYMNGKLAASRRSDAVIPCIDTSLVLGQSGNFKNGTTAVANPQFEIVMSKVNRSTYVMDPKTAYSMYLLGNGMGMYVSIPDYNVKMTLLKDNKVQNELTLK